MERSSNLSNLTNKEYCTSAAFIYEEYERTVNYKFVRWQRTR